MRTVGLFIQQLARTENIYFEKKCSTLVVHRYDIIAVSRLAIFISAGMLTESKNCESLANRYLVDLLGCRREFATLFQFVDYIHS